MSSAEPLVVGIDVGGTKVLAGAVDSGGSVEAPVELAVPRLGTSPREDVRRVEDTLTEAVRAVAGTAAVAAVGLAAAGFVDRAGEVVRFAPHLPWVDSPVRARLADRWGVPVHLENDATAAAHAEATFGAARGVSDALLVALGTGIGGGIVLDGRVRRGYGGMAGEFGHQQVVPEGVACECGGRGCWEQYCSGHALVRFARDRLGSVPSVLEEMCAGDPAALTGQLVDAAAADGDLLARDAFRSVGDWLGVGCANLVAVFDPELVVIGGGVSRAGDRLLEPARRALARSLVGAGHRDLPPLVAAAGGAEAGLVGAADLARGRLVGRAG